MKTKYFKEDLISFPKPKKGFVNYDLTKLVKLYISGANIVPFFSFVKKSNLEKTLEKYKNYNIKIINNGEEKGDMGCSI